MAAARNRADDGGERSPQAGAATARPTMESLVATCHADVYRFAFRLAGSADDAEDLVQQTFLVAQQHLTELRDVQRARSWLFTILRRLWSADQRRRHPWTATLLEMELNDVAGPSTQELEFDEERLRQALGELSDEARAVVLLFYFEECSYREIAAQLDLPIGTVMSRLARAKERLRSRLSEPAPALR
jgi:RNA polymerase sigma-70 factor, ECF subfamily